MPYITRQDNISILHLSVRSQNCLQRANIHTIGELIDFPSEELINIRNMGQKSVAEICKITQSLKSGDGEYILAESIMGMSQNQFLSNNSTSQAESPSDCKQVTSVAKDIPIEELQIPLRAKRGLNQVGYKYVSQLEGITFEKLMNIPKFGKKTAEELLVYLDTISLLPKDSQEICDKKTTFVQIAQEMSISYGKTESFWLKEILSTSEAHPEALGETLIYYLYNNDIVRNSLKKKILYIVEQNGDELPQSTIEGYLPSHLLNTTIFNEVLYEQEVAGVIEMGEVLVYRKYPSVIEFVAQIEDPRTKKVIQDRLEGKTLQEIGEQYHITRERVRQLLKGGLQKRPHLSEDKYTYIYNNYDFSEEDLSLAFDESKTTYNYLEMVSTNSRQKRKPIEELLSDVNVSPEMRRKAEKAIYKKYVTIDGVRVKKVRPELVKYFVKVLCKSLTKIDDFIGMYHAQLEILGLADDPTLILESRTYENILHNCDYVLWNQWRSFRYYNIPERDYDELLATINLGEYEDTEISALKLFRDYPELMEQYDIHDEYELHNLLKKTWSSADNKVSFKKMPTIEIGNANRDNQVLSLLLQYAPISAEALAERYEEAYGIKAGTVLANYMTAFDNYYYEGVYSVTSDNLPPYQFNRMQSVLSDDFYLVQEVKRLYLREFPDADINNINPYTLKTLGFRVYAGYSGYIVRNTYPNGSAYFNELLTKEDLVDIRDRNSKICYIGTYEKELYDLRAAYEIIEYLPLRYINIRRLNTLGITKVFFKDYCAKVAALYEKGDYFTTTSLYQDGFSHKLDDLGFEEWFSSSILIEDRMNFSYQRIGGTRIILRGKPNANIGEMITWILEKYQKIDLYELLDLLNNRYGISLPKEKVIEIIRGTELYYDTIMEAVYIDYDTYFEEI